MKSFKGKKLFIFGDSIICGAGNNGYGIGEFLRDHLGFDLVKYGVGGARVGFVEGKNWMVDQVREAVLNDEQPDYVVFNGFTNDCCISDTNTLCDVPLGEFGDSFENFDIFEVKKEGSTFANCFENILHAFKTYFPNAKLLFVRSHKMGRRDAVAQKQYGETAVALCKKWGVSVADIYEESDLDTFLIEHRDKYTADSYHVGHGDCTHPNELCYTEKYMPIIEKKIMEF